MSEDHRREAALEGASGQTSPLWFEGRKKIPQPSALKLPNSSPGDFPRRSLSQKCLPRGTGFMREASICFPWLAWFTPSQHISKCLFSFVLCPLWSFVFFPVRVLFSHHASFLSYIPAEVPFHSVISLYLVILQCLPQAFLYLLSSLVLWNCWLLLREAVLRFYF